MAGNAILTQKQLEEQACWVVSFIVVTEEGVSQQRLLSWIRSCRLLPFGVMAG